MNYQDFLASKMTPAGYNGIDRTAENPMLKDFQTAMVDWGLRKGRSCFFADCGLGKTPMQLEWANQTQRETNKPVLILAPLAVSKQTRREGEKFGIEVNVAESQSKCTAGINITNYEKLQKFDPSKFGAVVLDEASIIKAFDGKMRNQILTSFADTPYRLACTATPAPNDYTELGNQSEFLGVMSHAEMLAMYFINDMGQSAKWRLKGHAAYGFWEWICSWALIVGRPSDLGFDDTGYVLPSLERKINIVDSDWKPEGVLFASEVMSLQERRAARRASLSERVAKCYEIAMAEDTQFVIWCDLNDEAEAVTKMIPGAVNVQGKDTPKFKEDAMTAFADGNLRVLVTKPKIAGFGMNWQNCHRTILCGISDSYEAYYQLVRRFWRFGQKKPVTVDIVCGNQELPIVDNIERKERNSQKMADGVREFLQEQMQQQIKGVRKNKMEHQTKIERGENWTLYLGDCVETVKNIPDESIDFSIFSPPFASLYTYSSSERDMGNCTNDDDFIVHFGFLIEQLYRVLKPGREVSFHCMNLPTSKTRDGVIGLTDFRGNLIFAFQQAGFIYHSEVCIWKDPVLAMQRTKALGLLHKQLKKDSCMSRQGIPDYLVTMRKPGDNPNPVTHSDDDFPVSEWQRIASPIWTDINPSDTLQYRSAREQEDEKHICPLQLEVIRRALRLWTNEGDTVFTPFAGIGSELYVSLEMRRKAIGCELKPSYYQQAVSNCRQAESYANAQGKLELKLA